MGFDSHVRCEPWKELTPLPPKIPSYEYYKKRKEYTTKLLDHDLPFTNCKSPQPFIDSSEQHDPPLHDNDWGKFESEGANSVAPDVSWYSLSYILLNNFAFTVMSRSVLKRLAS
mmetsp:Transcript_16327/g.39843  ORF Transcript_16327/g.39843 Transcript_16327/m.39843 type:complete len:114 (-) Transcript_16327:338-679(-)